MRNQGALGPHGWRSRMRGIALALGMQGALFALLLLGLNRDVRQQVLDTALTAFSLPGKPLPPAKAAPAPVSISAPPAASGAAGRRSTRREIVAPIPPVDLAPMPAPQASATGSANLSGMRDTGVGAGVSGGGEGSGAGGAGQGGGGSPLQQIAGSIDSARDYPRAGRDARIGHTALIVFTVGVDGRVHDCQIRESSGDPASDAITCRLAQERFRFRPATDASGQPVERLYGWRQKWFY